MRRLLVAAALTLLGGPHAFAQSASCDLPSMNAAWRSGVEALNAGNNAAGAAALDPVIAACGGSQEAEPLRVLRAEIAVRLGDFARGRDLMIGVPRPSERSFGIAGSWTALRAARGLNEPALLNAERSQLLRASGEGLLARGATLRERTILNGGEVSFYETDILQGDVFRRRIIALYDRPDAYPLSATLTLNTMIAEMYPDIDVYFIDGYFCAGHATLEQLQGPKGQLPSYDVFRERALAFFAAPGAEDPPPETPCAFPNYLTPDPLQG